ncbi:gliding motility-associated C-terminal domain-containing protein [Taibaiella chishuiensis]|uniref:Gliding motility-associated-like protein n=1 Tax=Taibaiella chishuiensis TaxID=1434707 RepID=A0A2P8D5E3_9BACT|nr:gliding motility-associated C-terminal domain-containing protein [Taibaiella chishuiensis]PSK92440.1 gliding motility-associated-like protein [Taibaiella chishuiensis]
MRPAIQLTTLLVITLFLFSRCNKDDDFLPSWKCNLQEQELPAGDNARLFVPNAFTPNGDGLNDIFVPLYSSVTHINFTVYDNQGNVLFQTSERGKGWDGLSKSGTQYTIIHYAVEAVSAAGNRIARCGSAYRLQCVPKGVLRNNLIFSDQFDPAMPEGYLKNTTREQLPDCQ